MFSSISTTAIAASTVDPLHRPLSLSGTTVDAMDGLYATFLLCGTASLWPWNAFLSAAAFFQERLSNHQHLADNYTSTMMTVSTLTSVICNYMLSRHQAINYKKLLLYGNVLQASIFAIMAVSVLIETPQVPYFIFTLFAVLVSSVAACFTQVALMALANIRSAELSNATVVGNAVSGVLPSASMLAGGGRALWYFIASVVIVIVAQLAVFASDWKDGYKDEINIETMEESLVTDTPSNNSSVAYWDLKPIHPLHLVITITFFVTLVFPVFASSVTSPKVASKTFIPLAFFVWNSGDLLGRLLLNYHPLLPRDTRHMVAYSILRILFVPLFLFCNVKGRGGWPDGVYLLLQLVFGITNGHLFGAAYMQVGEVLNTDGEKQAAASYTALVINISLLAGSVSSYLVVFLIR